MPSPYSLTVDTGYFYVTGSAGAVNSVPIFPTFPGLGFPVIRTPEWNTDVQISISGKRTTLGRFIYPIYHYVLNFDSSQGGFLRDTSTYEEYNTLLAFFNFVGGRRDLFQYHDPYDDTATSQIFGTGDGSTTQFQLIRTISGSGFSWSDPIFSASISTLRNNGVAQTQGTDYEVSSTALITFTSAPASGNILTWDGTFNWLCRFEDDTEDFERFMYWLVELKKIRFSTEKI
jgi:uncharacterized protein (TIGR02217 family)